MTTTEHLPDAISAASLVLAILTALYTLWLPHITAALRIAPDDDKANRTSQYTQVTDALRTEALPLAIATVMATLILLPRGFAITAEFWAHKHEWAFDDVKAFFVLTLLLMLLLAIISVVQLVRLFAKQAEIGSPQKEGKQSQ